MSKQKKLYYDICNLKYKLYNLAGYIQDDFQKQLDDGTLVKEDIVDMLDDMKIEYNRFTKELNELKVSAISIMNKYINEQPQQITKKE